MIKERFNFSLSGGVKVVVAIVLFGVAGATIDTESNSNGTPVVVDTTPEIQEAVPVDTPEETIDEAEVVKQEPISAPNPASEQPVTENTVSDTPTPAVTQERPTLGERQAVRAAQNYIDFKAFSRSGLVEQLEFEGYSRAEAEYGVANIVIDWNEQAALSAASYLDYTNFSRSGLIEQLEFEGYTSAQAQYGATAVGY